MRYFQKKKLKKKTSRERIDRVFYPLFHGFHASIPHSNVSLFIWWTPITANAWKDVRLGHDMPEGLGTIWDTCYPCHEGRIVCEKFRVEGPKHVLWTVTAIKSKEKKMLFSLSSNPRVSMGMDVEKMMQYPDEAKRINRHPPSTSLDKDCALNINWVWMCSLYSLSHKITTLKHDWKHCRSISPTTQFI